MKKPIPTPINPDAPRAKQVKSYPLKSIQDQPINIDSYICDKNQKLYKIHDDFYVQSSDYDIKKHYNISCEK